MINFHYKILWIPVFHIGNKRIRARFRWIGWGGFHYVADRFSEGNVYRLWLGFVLLTAMVDER
jgi:hypothetical protein